MNVKYSYACASIELGQYHKVCTCLHVYIVGWCACVCVCVCVCVCTVHVCLPEIIFEGSVALCCYSVA